MRMMRGVSRGFPRSEFERRFEWIIQKMLKKDLEAIVLTSPNEIYYYTGLETQFFASPSRPYYLILTPRHDTPIAVFPEIMGPPILNTTWVDECRTWVSPNKVDDGVSLLLQTVQENLSGSSSCKIGFVLGSETKLHPCHNDVRKIFQGLESHEIEDVTSLIHEQRSIKSDLEIEKISHICGVVSSSLHNLPNLIETEISKHSPSLASNFTERDVCRVLRSDIMGQQHGADSIPYMMAQSGQGGYDNIVLGPTDRKLRDGDVLIVDTGSRFDGYFSDFDRNYVIGDIPDDTLRAHEALYFATQRGIDSCQAGNTASQVAHAMQEEISTRLPHLPSTTTGRSGHALGLVRIFFHHKHITLLTLKIHRISPRDSPLHMMITPN